MESIFHGSSIFKTFKVTLFFQKFMNRLELVFLLLYFIMKSSLFYISFGGLFFLKMFKNKLISLKFYI